MILGTAFPSSTCPTWRIRADEIFLTPEEAYNDAKTNFPNTQRYKRMHLEFLVENAELELREAKENLDALDDVKFPTYMVVV